jgi:hypothetical protein
MTVFWPTLRPSSVRESPPLTAKSDLCPDNLVRHEYLRQEGLAGQSRLSGNPSIALDLDHHTRGPAIDSRGIGGAHCQETRIGSRYGLGSNDFHPNETIGTGYQAGCHSKSGDSCESSPEIMKTVELLPFVNQDLAAAPRRTCMGWKTRIRRPCTNNQQPRIGGGALIGGTGLEWPTTPQGIPLTLLMSIPAGFITEHSGLLLPIDRLISVFSFYSKGDYFLDYISYHGDPAELEMLKKGYTQVVSHPVGEELRQGSEIPAMLIEIDQSRIDHIDSYQGSKIGGGAGFLQNESLILAHHRFVLQVYGGDFPRPYRDVLYLSDAVGYLFIDERLSSSSICSSTGMFFVQVT